MKWKYLIHTCLIIASLLYLPKCTPVGRDSGNSTDFYGLFTTPKPEQKVLLFDSAYGSFKAIDLLLPTRYAISPNGEFVVGFVDHHVSQLTDVELTKIQTGEQTIILTEILWPSGFVENISHSLIHWSHDSQKVAVLLGGPAWADNWTSTTEILIYDVVAKKVELHLKRGTWINTFSWSGESDDFAFLEIAKPCLDDTCNEANAAPWNLITYAKNNNIWQESASFPLTLIRNGNHWSASSACNLKWSTNRVHIALETPCQLYSLASTEIWILNTQQATWQKVSNNVYPEFETYRLFWSKYSDGFFLASTFQLIGETIERKSEFAYYEPVEDGQFRKTMGYPQDIYGRLSISPSEKYLLTVLENRAQFISLSNGEIIADFDVARSDFSVNGVWFKNGFATKVDGDVVLIHLGENSSMTSVADAEGLELLQLFRKE